MVFPIAPRGLGLFQVIEGMQVVDFFCGLRVVIDCCDAFLLNDSCGNE